MVVVPLVPVKFVTLSKVEEAVDCSPVSVATPPTAKVEEAFKAPEILRFAETLEEAEATNPEYSVARPEMAKVPEALTDPLEVSVCGLNVDP